MGFRKNAYCTIWDVKPISDVQTKARLSISRKDKQTGEYVDDFGGFVTFFGTVAAKKASKLKERDRIRLGDVDVRSKYDKEKHVVYYNFNIYSFETQDEINGGGPATDASHQKDQSIVGDGEIDDSRLPF